MSNTPAAPQAAAPRPTAVRSPVNAAPAVLFGIACVLGVMALVFLVLGLTQHESSTAVCRSTATTMGECLLASRGAMVETHSTITGALTLAAGALTAAVAGATTTALQARR